ncbi:NmrA family transcriptional regulator [Streptomyces sp. 150FB]|uniref:NAD(P)H-binding protein n=1 Tax=Streptomyces sp. 150FB TaxID=1576605 RepID=UPI000588F00B|nr:NAD(P)H-binding protein [Streptomyces sp. 150FB]KIF74476.1 NmrA family transcriptional regulator [Streptomyces sp. 150FB]
MIVVTAPTGQIGSQTLDRLVAAGAPVRVIVRDAAKLPDSVRDAVQVVEGSHGDPDVLTKAFAGAEAVFWVAPPDPRATRVEDGFTGFSRPAAEALAAHGVQRVVAVSALGRGTPMAENAGYVTASLAMDDLLAGSGVGYRALTMPSFMDNLLRQAELIRQQGMITSPIAGDRRMPFCAVRDIAEVAAELLLDDTWTGVEDVPVLGAEDLSFEDIARITSEVLERPVRFQQVSGEDFKARMTRFGTTEAMARGALDMMLAKDAGMDNAVPRTARATTPTGFRQWCEDVLKPAVLG